MSARHPVSLHISLAPRDVAHAGALLPHQLRQLAPHVEEVVLTVDGGPGTQDDDAALAQFRSLVEPWRDAGPRLVLRNADYSPARRRELAAAFFRHGTMPAQTYRAGPFHAYFDGWFATSREFVFHLDSDIFLGGDVGGWLAEAIALLRSEPQVLACNPLPGPPAPDFRINQPQAQRWLEGPRGAHRFDSFTTRLFFMNRARLVGLEPCLHLRRAAWRQQVRGFVERTSPYALPEDIISEYQRARGWHRVDFLGAAPGLWSLHPPFRNAEFYQKLPELVRRIETDDLPPAQRGDYDLNDSLVDWSDARAALATNRWWKRYWPRR
ncbi:MAG TPA: hypothetical protein VGD81_20740 [Opitutaceae bacterium]